MNRKFLNLILLVLPLAACTPDNGQEQIDAQAPYTLSVDKTEIESDGKQAATFTIVDANGKVLTDDNALMSKIYFKNEATGSRLTRRTRAFKTIDDGEYTFSATVSGDPCENTVTIRSVNRSKYEVFRKNVCVYRFTATGCQYCPSMTKGYGNVSAWTKSRYVEMAIHGMSSNYQIGNGAIPVELLTHFNGSPAYPSCVYDLDFYTDEKQYPVIQDQIFERLANNPATCGIKADCSYKDGIVSINATIKTSTGGKYDAGYALLKDNCPGDAASYEEVYNNVVLAISGNYMYMSDNASQVDKDAEAQFSYKNDQITVPSSDDLDEYFIVVFALKQEGSKVVIDNVVRMPLIDGSVDYIYN